MADFVSDRYSRQVLFPGIGADGQQRLSSSCVAIAGCGALGAFQAGALARAGVGRLILIDRDYVEWSNLQRQWLYDEEDARQALPKAVAAARKLATINSEVNVRAEIADLTSRNIDDLLDDAAIVLDGTDNFETRYLINEYAVKRGIPWVYGGAVSSYGVVMPVVPDRAACFACAYPTPPSGAQATCDTAGVINTITSIVASLQVSWVYRLLLAGAAEAWQPLKVTTIDVWTGQMRQISVPPRRSDCQVCGLRQFPYLDGERRAPISLCGRNAVQIHERQRPVDLARLAEQLQAVAKNLRLNEFALRAWLDDFEMTVFPDGRAIIKGTTDPGVARSIYARYIGS